ncbi:MAG: acetylxylan esterase [Lentisphaerae bacterium]|nr:acetylxylan esterase [Lentisphaerota bacterium]
MPAAPSVRTDRENARYGKDEIITFIIDGLPAKKRIGYVVELDSDEKIMSGNVPASGKVSVKAGRPGFVNIKVNTGAATFEAAAAVSPEKIKPSLPKPDDFDEFWHGKLRALSKVPACLKIEKIAPLSQFALEDWREKWPFYGDHPVRTKEIASFKFEAANLMGSPARGYFAMPKNAKAGSLPALLTTHGAGVGDSDLPKTCAGAEHGLLVMDINVHGLFCGQAQSYYRGVADTFTGLFNSYSCFQRGKYDRETLYFVEMFLRHRRALDVLCSQKQWDGKNLIVNGVSQGGTLALACAALDERVTTICAGLPALVDCTFAYPLKNWFGIEGESPENARRIRSALRYASLCNFAGKTNAAAYFTAAYLDRACHPTTIYAGYNLYVGSKKIHDAPLSGHGNVPNQIHFQEFSDFMFSNLK